MTRIHRGADETDPRRTRAIVDGDRVRLADLLIELTATDLQRAEAIASVLGALPRGNGAPDLTIRFDDEQRGVPEREPDEEYPDLSVWRQGEELLLRHRDDVTARATTSGFAVGGKSDALRSAFRRISQPALTHVLGHHDRFVLHGGAIARNARAVVLLGATGQGKSTLVAAAASVGWKVLGDDLVILSSGPDGPRIVGIPKTVAIPSELGIKVPIAGRIPGDPRGRYELPPEVLTPGWHTLGAALRVAHGKEADSELEPFSGPRLMRFVIGSFPSAANPDLLQRFYPLAGTISRLPGWTLRHSADLAQRLESSARALDVLATNL
ncbi:MAG: hypothetical protein ACRDLB_04255 [Actinomycetota bacterium]